MKKYKYLLLSLFIPLLLPTKIYAECTKEDIDHFKEIENQYTIAYEFDIETKLYTLILNNPNVEEYDYISEKNNIFKNCQVTDKNTAKCTQVQPGEYIVKVVNYKKNCTEGLKEITLSLPQYNNYSEDPLCDGLEEFVLCQPTYDKVIDYDTFVARVKLYKESKAKEEVVEKQLEEKNESKIVKYIKDNLVQIIVTAVFTVMVIVTIILTIKSIRKSRRLE